MNRKEAQIRGFAFEIFRRGMKKPISENYLEAVGILNRAGSVFNSVDVWNPDFPSTKTDSNVLERTILRTKPIPIETGENVGQLFLTQVIKIRADEKDNFVTEAGPVFLVFEDTRQHASTIIATLKRHTALYGNNHRVTDPGRLGALRQLLKMCDSNHK